MLRDAVQLERRWLFGTHAAVSTTGEGAHGARPHREGCYEQYFLYSPTQTWLFFKNPALKSSV